MSLFRDARLRRLYRKGDARGLSPERVKRVRTMLTALMSMTHPRQLAQHPTWRPHRLKGDLKGFWAVDVSARERLVFRFQDDRVWDISMVDYH